MDFRRENSFSSGNVVHILAGNSRNAPEDAWGSAPDQAMWATEDEYRENSIDTNPNANSFYDARQSQSQTRSDSEPPAKRSRNPSSENLASSNRSKAIGKMFYKTKLCCKFRAGTCPYVTNCNFAHSIEELRKPPPNWQEIVAAHEEEQQMGPVEPREEYQIPIIGTGDEGQRSYKGRHCKKFYTEEGCPYGENCTFIHDEQSKARESVAISLGPGSGSGYGNTGNSPNLKPSNWKTRICNKWELTGYCPFGSKCHFAHGTAELHRYGGAGEGEAKDSYNADPKQGVPTFKASDNVVPSTNTVPHSDNYLGVPSQRLANVTQTTGLRAHLKWKGPNRINKIYGDWIDDFDD